MIRLPVLSPHGIGNQRGFQICWLHFFLSSELFLPFCLIFFTIIKRFFITNFVTCVRKFVTRITKFVICVTKFVTNFFYADSEKCIGLRKKYLRHSKKHKGYNASLEQVRCAKCLEGILHKKSASKFGAEWQGIGTKCCLFLK